MYKYSDNYSNILNNYNLIKVKCPLTFLWIIPVNFALISSYTLIPSPPWGHWPDSGFKLWAVNQIYFFSLCQSFLTAPIEMNGRGTFWLCLPPIYKVYDHVTLKLLWTVNFTCSTSCLILTTGMMKWKRIDAKFNCQTEASWLMSAILWCHFDLNPTSSSGCACHMAIYGTKFEMFCLLFFFQDKL